jgi:transposase-like protein
MRIGREQRARHVERWRESGLVAREYAARAGVNVHTLRSWKYALADEKRPSAVTTPKTTAVRSRVIAPKLPLIEVRGSGRTDEHFELEFADGRRLRVPPSFDADALRRLLAALEVPA